MKSSFYAIEIGAYALPEDPLIILRAWCNSTKSVLAQFKVPFGTNEITTIPMILKDLYLKGKIVTIDAIGAQKKLLEK